MAIKSIQLTTGKISRSFGIEHAERLLNLKDNGGWRIADSSKFKFENGSISVVKKSK